jgi:hypothetical protein
MYIGSSHDVEKRYKSHVWALRSGRHTVADMQDDYDEYGEDYSLYILGEITEFEERGAEYEWMRKYQTIQRGVGYNYMDKERVISHSINDVPFKDGLPNPLAREDES